MYLTTCRVCMLVTYICIQCVCVHMSPVKSLGFYVKIMQKYRKRGFANIKYGKLYFDIYECRCKKVSKNNLNVIK